MDDTTTPRGEPSGMRSPRQRFSDESREGKATKKKSGFTNFVNNLVGTQRKPTISAPENPVHVTHVGYDQETGEFTVGLDEIEFASVIADRFLGPAQRMATNIASQWYHRAGAEKESAGHYRCSHFLQ